MLRPGIHQSHDPFRQYYTSWVPSLLTGLNRYIHFMLPQRRECMLISARYFGGGKTASPVADPERVHWVPWNPSFEELPSKILCANILCTRRSHWSKALQLPISDNARVSTPLSRIRRAHGLCSRIMSELKQRFYSCNTPSAAKDGDMLSVWERLFSCALCG